MTQVVKYPDLMIYLKSTVPHLVKNIQKRGRDYEQTMPLEYLDNLNKRYDQFIFEKYKGKVQFYKVNADENEELMQLYGIDGLPTIFFCNGEDIQMNSGAQSQAEFDKIIREML